MLRDTIDLIQKYKDLLTGTKWKAILSDEPDHDDSIIKFRLHGKRSALQAKVWNSQGQSDGWYTAGVRADGEVAFHSDAETLWQGDIDPFSQSISFHLQETYIGAVVEGMSPYVGAVLAIPVGSAARQPMTAFVF